MQPTKLIYLEDFKQVSCEATVLSVIYEDDRVVIVLDQTVFYPQGGGQPYDQGIIKKDGSVFSVAEVRFIDGMVRHIGTFQSGNFQAGDVVTCDVDLQRRSLHSRLHSAGHVVDMAVNALKLSWIAGKGYHFPDGPYVEYHGTLTMDIDREQLKKDIEEKCNKLIRQGAPGKLLFMDKDKMHEVCAHVPDYIPEGKPARVVLFGRFGVPCGGTHVNNISQIKHMTIRKLKVKGENIQVGYDVER